MNEKERGIGGAKKDNQSRTDVFPRRLDDVAAAVVPLRGRDRRGSAAAASSGESCFRCSRRRHGRRHPRRRRCCCRALHTFFAFVFFGREKEKRGVASKEEKVFLSLKHNELFLLRSRGLFPFPFSLFCVNSGMASTSFSLAPRALAQPHGGRSSAAAARTSARCDSVFESPTTTAALLHLPPCCPVARRRPSFFFPVCSLISLSCSPLVSTLYLSSPPPGPRPASRGPRPRSGRLARSAGKEESTEKKVDVG